MDVGIHDLLRVVLWTTLEDVQPVCPLSLRFLLAPLLVPFLYFFPHPRGFLLHHRIMYAELVAILIAAPPVLVFVASL